jgi:cytochrome c oxidase subunit 2
MEKLLGLPVLASQHGKDVDNLIVYIHWLMIVLFVGWLAYFAYTLFRFHRKRNPKADYLGVKSHASNYIEGAVAIVEMVLLFGLAVPLWAKVVDTPPREDQSTLVRVVAQQFGWNIIYPGTNGVFRRQDMRLATSENPLGFDPSDKTGFTTLNEMHVPVNKPVIVHLTSRDVIHSFKVIALRVCQDAIPGLRIPVWFTPTQVGKYQINCAQLCGNGHSSMSLGFLTVDTQEDYEKWLAGKLATGATSGSFE